MCFLITTSRLCWDVQPSPGKPGYYLHGRFSYRAMITLRCFSPRLTALLNTNRLKKQSLCSLTNGSHPQHPIGRCMAWSASQHLGDRTEIRTGCGEQYLRQASTVGILQQKCDPY